MMPDQYKSLERLSDELRRDLKSKLPLIFEKIERKILDNNEVKKQISNPDNDSNKTGIQKALELIGSVFTEVAKEVSDEINSNGSYDSKYLDSLRRELDDCAKRHIEKIVKLIDVMMYDYTSIIIKSKAFETTVNDGSIKNGRHLYE